MNTENREIAIQFAKVDKHMKEALIAVEIMILFIIISMSYFFWFITR